MPSEWFNRIGKKDQDGAPPAAAAAGAAKKEEKRPGAQAARPVRLREQDLNAEEEQALRRIRERLASEDLADLPEHEQQQRARSIVLEETSALPRARRETIMREVLQYLGGGLGPLQPFMDDPDVTEIMVNRPDQVYVERQGTMVLTDVRFRSDEEVRALVERLVSRVGRNFNLSEPMVDARLPESGSRLNAIMPPLALLGTSVTIRKFPHPFTFEELVQSGTIPDGQDGGFDVAGALRWAVKNRLNIVVSGGTGSGKCLRGDTPVPLTDGRLLPIREIVENLATGPWALEPDGWAWRPVQGIDVLSWDAKTGRLVEQPVTAVWRGPAPRELVRIVTVSGREVVVTREHPLPVVNGGGVRWRAASELAVDDRLVVPRKPVAAADMLWDPVQTIQAVACNDPFVYDLSVGASAGGGTFVAGFGPMLVHNTTLLNVLTSLIPDRERLVVVEDAAELQPQQPHVVRLESRPPNVEGKGEVRIRELVRNALRMRPDRIIVGEVRGGEALDMLQAMNTGHPGSMTTVHANSPRDALLRLESMVLMAGTDMPLRAIRQQIGSAVHLIVQIARVTERDGDALRVRRRIVEVVAVRGFDPATGDIRTETIYEAPAAWKIGTADVPEWARPWFEEGGQL